jgi:hypothetical protein
MHDSLATAIGNRRSMNEFGWCNFFYYFGGRCFGNSHGIPTSVDQ